MTSNLWSARMWRRAASALAACLLLSLPALASVPDWVRAAAREATPAYPPDTDAVVLLHERITTVKGERDIRTVTRYVYKVLRPEGRGVASVTVHYDNDTSINWLKAWSISPRTGDYELKEKDAIDVAAFNDELYSDLRLKHFELPGVEPGSIVAYEVDHRDRSNILQDEWDPQEQYPVLQARYGLELPAGWDLQARWRNYPASDAQTSERRWSWQLHNLPPIKPEPMMPPWRALAARLSLSFGPAQATRPAWAEVGRWYGQLVRDRGALTPELRKTAAELAPPGTPAASAARALARFVQREVRYVAVEVGIGGYQPHAAQEVLAKRYGDCKDKVTLLRALLQSVGIDSYYVLTHSERGFIDREFPSMLNFDHVILAIKLPPQVSLPGAYALYTASAPAAKGGDSGSGRLLFFDPTSEFEPLGSLPGQLEEGVGLLVNEDGGELVELPGPPVTNNRLERAAKFTLTSTGDLSGELRETRKGGLAALQRARLIPASQQERQKIFESYLGKGGTFHFLGASIEDLQDPNRDLVYRVKLLATSYGQAMPPLMLLRAAAVGSMSSNVLEAESRLQAVELGFVGSLSDDFEFALPANYQADDLPAPVELKFPFGDYSSSVKFENGVLHFRRECVVKQRQVPADQLAQLKTFYRRIREDEQSLAVLKVAAK